MAEKVISTESGSSLSAETVVALSTPEGESGLAVVRLSGPAAVEVARKVFRHNNFRSGPESHRAYHGVVVTHRESGQTAIPDEALDKALDKAVDDAVDEVVALPMLAPRSYTGEDVVEFFCHGGRMPARLVVKACLQAGAVPASAGEFTRRAFLNGKLSLDQAEAVADLIHAEDELTASGALQQLRGGLDRELTAIENPLKELLADLEGSLEFAEEESVSIPRQTQLEILESVLERTQKLLALAPAGRYLRDGIQVALVGPPNVGKSSLFNALLGEFRALVDHEPGTTRDVVQGRVRREGILFVLHDTAGLRQEDILVERVERMGMQRTFQTLGQADVILVLSEAKPPRTEPHAEEILIDIDEYTKEHDKGVPNVLYISTKTDLIKDNIEGGTHIDQYKLIETSSKTGDGLSRVWDELLETVHRSRIQEAAALGVVLNSRHQRKLISFSQKLADLRDEIDLEKPSEGHSGFPSEEVVATLLAGILAELGEISGRVFTESLLESVFSRFCVGK